MPIPVAATVFAVIMALANLGSSLAEVVGGYVFELASSADGAVTAYRLVIVLSVGVIVSCWWWVPQLGRALSSSPR